MNKKLISIDLKMKPTRIIVLASAFIMMFGVAPAMAVEQCFGQAGTYGNLVVTESGSGCGTLDGAFLWLSDESCQFTISPAVDGSNIWVNVAALSVLSITGAPDWAEESIFKLNGIHVAVVTTGTLLPSVGGINDPTIGGVTAVPDTPGGGSGQVSFRSAPISLTSIEIQNNWINGGVNGAAYQVCFDDGVILTPRPMPVPMPKRQLPVWEA